MQTLAVTAAALFLVAIAAVLLAVLAEYPRAYFVAVALVAVAVLDLWRRRQPPD